MTQVEVDFPTTECLVQELFNFDITIVKLSLNFPLIVLISWSMGQIYLVVRQYNISNYMTFRIQGSLRGREMGYKLKVWQKVKIPEGIVRELSKQAA